MNTQTKANWNTLILMVGLFFTALNATASCRVDTVYQSDRYAGTIENRKISILINTYNTNNNVTSTFLQTFYADSGKYFPSQRDTFIYDASQRVVTNSSESYNFTTRIWRKNKKTDNTYSASGALLVITNSSGIGSPSTWQFSNKTTYTLDASNNVIEEVYQTWVSATSSWVNSNRWVRTYASNRLTSEIKYDYNATTLVWDEKEKRSIEEMGWVK